MTAASDVPARFNAEVEKFADALARRLRPVLGRGVVRDLLGGKWLGHSVHPGLVALPLGMWSSAIALDLSGGQQLAARRLVGLGTAMAPLAIVTGWSDWSVLNTRQRRVGVFHAAANATAVTLFSLSYWRRRTRTDGVARAASILGLSAAAGGGAIGGHLTYRMGANVAPSPSAIPAAAAYDPAQLPDAMDEASGLES